MRTARLAVPHLVQGRTILPDGGVATTEYEGFTTPALDLDDLVWSRSEAVPAADVPVAEIIDFLEALGTQLDLETNPYMQQALQESIACSSLGERILERSYRDLPRIFDPASLWFQVDQEIGREALDGWKPVTDVSGRTRHVRAFTRCDRVDRGSGSAQQGGASAQAALERPLHR
jgi:hypothetical protein